MDATGGAASDSGGTGADGSGGGEDCALGAEGCACTEGGGCDPGLTCASELCVDLGDMGSGGGGSNTGGASAAGGSAGAGAADTGGNGSGAGTGSGGEGGEGGGAGGNSGGPDHCLNQPNVNHSPGATVTSSDFYVTTERNEIGYLFYSGVAGTGFQSVSIDYTGTKFLINDLVASGGQNDRALAPFVACGEVYAPNLVSPPSCGLPLELAGTTRVDFGARFRHGGDGWDYSLSVDMTFLDEIDSEIWVTIAPRISDSYEMDAFDVTTGVQVGGDPEPWNVGYNDDGPAPWVYFFRPPDEEGREIAGDALEFLQVASNDYGLEAETLQYISATATIYYGPITDLELEDFCVEVE